MTLDEQIEGIERVRQIIVEKGQEFTRNFIELYRLLGGREFIPDKKFTMEFKNDNIRTRVTSKRGSLNVTTKCGDYVFYEVRVVPEVEVVKKGLLRREMRKTGDLEVRITSDSLNLYYIPPKDFFAICAEKYVTGKKAAENRRKIEKIFEHMDALPGYLAEYLEQLKQDLAKLGELDKAEKGLQRLRSALGYGKGEANQNDTR